MKMTIVYSIHQPVHVYRINGYGNSVERKKDVISTFIKNQAIYFAEKAAKWRQFRKQKNSQHQKLFLRQFRVDKELAAQCFLFRTAIINGIIFIAFQHSFYKPTSNIPHRTDLSCSHFQKHFQWDCIRHDKCRLSSEIFDFYQAIYSVVLASELTSAHYNKHQI